MVYVLVWEESLVAVGVSSVRVRSLRILKGAVTKEREHWIKQDFVNKDFDRLHKNQEKSEKLTTKPPQQLHPPYQRDQTAA